MPPDPSDQPSASARPAHTEQHQAPRPQPTPSPFADDALHALGCDVFDTIVLRDVVSSLGALDPTIGETVGWDRRTLGEAATLPLHRTPIELLPVEGESPAYHVETRVVPSGRVFQVQRRFPSLHELHAVLQTSARFAEPALWVRELLVPPLPMVASHQLAAYDAATVVPPAESVDPDA